MVLGGEGITISNFLAQLDHSLRCQCTEKKASLGKRQYLQICIVCTMHWRTHCESNLFPTTDSGLESLIFSQFSTNQMERGNNFSQVLYIQCAAFENRSSRITNYTTNTNMNLNKFLNDRVLHEMLNKSARKKKSPKSNQDTLSGSFAF